MTHNIGDLVYTWERFTSRALTAAEERTWRDKRKESPSEALPEGVGRDPGTVKGYVEKPDGTAEKVAVTKLAPGVYRVEAKATQAGIWRVGIDGTGEYEASREHRYRVRAREVERV